VIDYNELALQVAKAEDPGGELVKILEAIDEVLEADRPAILIMQAIPEDTDANPIVHISVFTNTGTDFPLETDERYVKWVKDYAKGLK
jgi:hypothetical protein